MFDPCDDSGVFQSSLGSGAEREQTVPGIAIERVRCKGCGAELPWKGVAEGGANSVHGTSYWYGVLIRAICESCEKDTSLKAHEEGARGTLHVMGQVLDLKIGIDSGASSEESSEGGLIG